MSNLPSIKNWVINGTFTNGTSSWAADRDSYIFAESNKVKIINGATGFGGASQWINGLTLGRYYVVSVDFEQVNGSGFLCFSQYQAGTGTRFYQSAVVTTSQTLIGGFYASLVDGWIGLSQGSTATPGTIIYGTNFKLYEVTPGFTSHDLGFIYKNEAMTWQKIQDLTPLHHWRLNEQSGGVANDCGSSPIAGSVTSVTLNQSGKIDKSAFFLGTSTSYIDCGINSCNFVNENFTVCYWMNCATITAEVVVLGNGQSAAKGWYMENTSGNIQLIVNNTAARYVRGGSLTVSTWTHIAASKYNSTGTLYQNGTEITTYAARENISSITSSDLPFLIGKYGPQVGYDYRGYLEDVRIYDRALTQQEIQQIYNLGRGTYDHSWKSGFPTVKPPIHHWKLNDATNSVLALDSGSVPIAGSNTSIGGYLQAGFQNNSYSMLFTGTASYIKLPALSLTTTNKVSISAWVKCSSTVSDITMFEYSPVFGSNNAFDFWLNQGGLAGCAAIGDHNTGYNVTFSKNPSYADGQWHHVVGTVNRDILTNTQTMLYIDGVNAGTLSSSYTTINSGAFGAYDAYIGSRAGTGSFFNGSLSDIRVYDYALSSDEVRNLYNLGRGVYHLT